MVTAWVLTGIFGVCLSTGAASGSGAGPTKVGGPQEEVQVVVAESKPAEILKVTGRRLPSPDRARVAFVALMRDPEHPDERDSVVVQAGADAPVGRYRVPTLSHRPLTGLRWLSPTRLRFDFWSSPHFGYRFEVDVTTRKVVRRSFLKG